MEIRLLTPGKATENNSATCSRCGDEHGEEGTVTVPVSTVEILRMADKSTAVAQVDLMFRAFCDRTRLRILNLLRDGELCVGDIVELLQLPQPKVSRHLAHLRKAGLVTTRREGLWCHYSLASPRTAFHRKILECATTCFKDVPEIQSDNARARKLRKAGGCCQEKARRSPNRTRRKAAVNKAL